MFGSDSFTLVLALLTPIFAASTLYLGIKHYRESSKKKQYMSEALLSIQSVTKKLQWIREKIQGLIEMDRELDATNDLDVLVDDILRAHLDLKSDKLTVHFRISEIEVEKREEPLPYEPNASRINEMLSKGEIRYFHTDTQIEGFDRRVSNSPDLRELVNMHRELLGAINEINRFKETYEALGPDLVRLAQEAANSLRDIIGDCARNKEVRIDVGTLDSSEELSVNLFEELLSIKKLEKEASQIERLMIAIQNVRRELFRISYLQQ